jgi:hypothetical protein
LLARRWAFVRSQLRVLLPPSDGGSAEPRCVPEQVADVAESARVAAASTVLLLALATGGGAADERCLPLLVDDGDWDAVGDRLHELTPSLTITTPSGWS